MINQVPKRQTLSILFYLRKDKSLKLTKVPIYLRITVNGKRSEMAIHRTIDPKRWNKDGGFARGHNDESKALNDYLNVLKKRVYDAQVELLDFNEPVDAISLRNIVQGESKYQYSLMELFEYHNQQILEKVPNHYSHLTWVRYNTTMNHCRSYMRYKYKLDDLPMGKLNYEFIHGLEHYLITIRRCNHNTTIKYLKNLKKIVNLAIKNEWIHRDPFIAFPVSLKSVKREYLNRDELSEIEGLKYLSPRLEQVRDVFVFSCYTGLAYVDVSRLSVEHIKKGVDGDEWIFIERKKTSTESTVPLLPQAKEIIGKYWQQQDDSNLRIPILPVISNQKMNAYLKEIGKLTNIRKVLTFHLARHTFATTVTLTNGVSIESVGKMLGHKDLRTTQIYAKVVDEKVSHDMQNLKKLFLESRK